MGLVATSGAYDYGYGPYTAEDLFALPDEGKSFELVDGWLIELSPSARHNFTANRLRRVIERAAGDAGAEAYVEAPMDISTPAGVRRPEVRLLEGDRYGEPTTLGERHTLEVSEPFPICFKLSILADFS
jgi:hypothetical protein